MGQSEKQLWEAQGVARGQRPEQGLQTLHTVGDEAQLGWGSGVTPTARAECGEEQEDPGPVFLGHHNVRVRRALEERKLRPRGKRGLVQGHNHASYPAKRIGLGLPLTEA